MNDDQHIFFATLATIIVVGGLILLFVSYDNNYNEKWEGVCLEIGEKKQLDYYEFDGCHPFEDCSIKCKFTDEKGDIVVKEVA